MPNMVQGWGPQGFEPSGGPQTMSAEQKLQSMIEAMGGAPNSVLQMIARILKSGDGAAPAMPSPTGNSQMPPSWNSLYPMPPVRGPIQFPGVNSGDLPAPMRPSEPPMMMNPNPGFIRG